MRKGVTQCKVRAGIKAGASDYTNKATCDLWQAAWNNTGGSPDIELKMCGCYKNVCENPPYDCAMWESPVCQKWHV